MPEGGVPHETWVAVMERAEWRCEWCGVPAYTKQLEADHIRQRVLGGGHSLENLRALCVDCHAERHGGTRREKVDWDDQRMLWEEQRRHREQNRQHREEGGYLGYGDKRL